MVCLEHNLLMSCPKILDGQHNDFRIKIYPQTKPNYWGNPTIWKMLLHSGLVHCRFVCKSRKRDPYSLIYAYFAAVSMNSSPEEIARMQGKKIWHTAYGNPMTNSGHYLRAIK